MPQIQSFFDTTTASWTHVVWDGASNHAAIIDPVLDYDPYSGRTGTSSADRLIEFVRNERLDVKYILETHAHADHLTAAQYLKEQLGGIVAIGDGIRSVQKTFRDVFNLGREFPADGSQFDRLLQQGEHLVLGQLEIEVIATPGHTDDSISLRIENAVFIGDTMFSPGYGTARCDFPGGNAGSLYRSICQLLSFNADTRLYLCHDYPKEGDQPLACVSVAEQRQHNIHVHAGISEDDFVSMRESRDATLNLPRLLLPAVQFNIRAGRVPDAEENGVSYLKIPLNQL